MKAGMPSCCCLGARPNLQPSTLEVHKDDHNEGDDGDKGDDNDDDDGDDTDSTPRRPTITTH